jgi:hypothetical protein
MHGVNNSIVILASENKIKTKTNGTKTISKATQKQSPDPV